MREEETTLTSNHQYTIPLSTFLSPLAMLVTLLLFQFFVGISLSILQLKQKFVHQQRSFIKLINFRQYLHLSSPLPIIAPPPPPPPFPNPQGLATTTTTLGGQALQTPATTLWTVSSSLRYRPRCSVNLLSR